MNIREAIRQARITSRIAGHATVESEAYLAELLEATFLIIDRDELPTATIIQRDGKDHVEVDSSEAGTWPISSDPERNRRWGLEYLAAAEMIVEYRSKRATLQRQLDGRREALSIDFGLQAPYKTLPVPQQRMINRIIELEDKK